MAKFDEVFSKLSAQMTAVIEVIAQDPALAAQVRDAIDSAQTQAEIEEQAAQDDARANALNNMLREVRQSLAVAAPDAPPLSGDPEPAAQPEPAQQPEPAPDQGEPDPAAEPLT